MYKLILDFQQVGWAKPPADGRAEPTHLLETQTRDRFRYYV